MYLLLSPAKSLREGPALDGYSASEPTHLSDTRALAGQLKQLSAADLKGLMGISDKLGSLNAERYQAMSFPFTRDNARQAALLFAGDVYRGLDASSLSSEDLDWAQHHVGILSGLYGLLRPLDLVQPYRLEMGTSLSNPRGKDLYAWWGTRIADEIASRLPHSGDSVVVNCASNEYFSAVDVKALGARVVTPVFKDVRDGKARILAFFAKQARGAMARWAIEHRVTDAEVLKQAEVMGYRFMPEVSTEDRWEFHRPQPPKKS